MNPDCFHQCDSMVLTFISACHLVLDLNGGSGDDVFVVRSFVNLVVAANGTLLAPDVGKIKLTGADDNDVFDVSTDAQMGDSEEEEFFSTKGDDPDYVVNSLVDIDGGTGTDRLVVVGTEFDDSYVVTSKNIYGGGLSIKFVNIELLEVSCEEGNDLVSVLSTSPNTETKIYGFLGSDQFVITPRNVDPVVSKNLRGHRGILEHVISSEDPDYNMLLIEGVAVDVLDNDGGLGYINVVEFEPFHLLTEDGAGSFVFAVYPTRKPDESANVVVDVVAPAAKDMKRYFTFNDTEGVLSLTFTDLVAQYVEVKYNSDGNVKPLEISDFDLLIKINLNVELTTDPGFKATNQSILPVDVRLIPGIENKNAKSVTVFQPTGRTLVAEGDDGFDATYSVFLRPCTNEMAMNTKLSIVQSVAGQVQLDKSEIVEPTANDWNVAGGCNVTITVTPSNDAIQEGDHFVTLSHVVTDATTGGPVLLSDSSTLFTSNVLVRIYDDDIGSVIVQETGAVTSTAEINDPESLSDTALYQDEYKLRLTKQPTDNVVITVVSQPTATDRNVTSTSALQRDYTERIQAHVGVGEVGGTQAENVTVVFTNVTWNVWQTIRVTAVNDQITEGVDLLPFPSQPSYLSFIQGPILLSGAESASFPSISSPLLLPGENNTATFDPPIGTVIDQSSLLVLEEKQVDLLRIYNTDVRGNEASTGTLTKSQLSGFNMAENIVISGNPQVNGIEYSGMEIVEIYLGDGTDVIIVEETSEAIHLLDTGGGDDRVRIKDISGPFIIHGQNGSDVVDVSSNETKLDRIEALLAFDGGTDGNVDRLNIDNSGSDDKDVIFVSRLMVEFENLMPSRVEDRANLPENSFLINLRGASGGIFVLEFNESETTSSIHVSYPISAPALESLIQHALIPKDVELASCGKNQTSKCSNAVKVYEIGQTFAVFFVGERLNTGLTVTLDVSNLTSFVPEVFQNITVDLLKRNSDIAYANLEVLDIKTGTEAAIVNVRGTSARTNITTQDKDDFVFISSDASENSETAASLEFLTGWLDYLEKDLSINVGIGRHRLLISDENSAISKGVDATGPAELTRDSLTNIGDHWGDIFYTAEGGNWSAGVNLWLGKGDDRLDVLSVPSNPGSTFLRTTTTVRAGPGEDTVNIALDAEEHQGTVFVANGQANKDVINASQSTLGVILFGDGGDDRILGGLGRDVVFGDFGRVVWKSFPNVFDRSDIGVVTAVAGGDGKTLSVLLRHIFRESFNS